MKLTLRTNEALQWRLSRMPLEQRHEMEADIETGSIDRKELERLTAPLTLADFPTCEEKSAYITQHGFAGYQDVLDETVAARAREAEQKKNEGK